MSAPDFQTSTEAEAFNDIEKQTSSGDRHLDNISIWCAARDYFTRDGEKSEGSVSGVSDRELRQIAVNTGVGRRSFKLMYKFLQEAMTPEDQELAIQAAHLSRGEVSQAREIYTFLSGESDDE